MDFLEKISLFEKEKLLTAPVAETLRQFYDSYIAAVQKNRGNLQEAFSFLDNFLDVIIEQIKEPYSFPSYHPMIRAPFDYYRFGLNFLAPLVKREESKIYGMENVEEFHQLIRRGDNVILFANHQTEPDPQAISLLLGESHPDLAEEMIFVAGHRVTTDPLTVPFSKGRNLLCIYSKKYIEHPPEKKQEKIFHNQRTMKKMRELLSEGGKCIYVAPSGGRDRQNDQGQIEIAKFDPQSIQMFLLMAKHSKKPTHFYPLALSTYRLLPPPNEINIDLGERRHAQCAPIYLSFGKEIHPEKIPGLEALDKNESRKSQAEHIWRLVRELYEAL